MDCSELFFTFYLLVGLFITIDKYSGVSNFDLTGRNQDFALLIRQHSLFCKMLALKADDRGTAATIAEHIFREGLLQGKGEVNGSIKLLETLFRHPELLRKICAIFHVPCAIIAHLYLKSGILH